LHHDFIWETYIVAKKHGFDKNIKIGKCSNLTHFIFKRFGDFNSNTVTKIAEEFASELSVPDPETGLTPFLQYIVNADLNESSYELLQIMVDSQYPIIPAKKDLIINDIHIKPGMTPFEVVQLKQVYIHDFKWKSKILELLK
jgi:hypothetical protein